MCNSPKTGTPDISVVIPAFNAEATIERCVASIQSNHNISLEIIIVNDGSSDRTKQICDQLAESAANVHIIHKKNGGVGSARNIGIAQAKGKYLAFVDSDDMVSKEMYVHMIAIIEQYEADCVVCNIDNLFSDHTELETHVFSDQVICGRDEVHERIVVPLIVPGHKDASLLQSGCNKLYRTEKIRECGLSFSALPWAEDWLFNIEYLNESECVAFTTASLYQYDRTTEGSLSKTWNYDSFDNTVWIQNRLAELFPERYAREQLLAGVLGIQREQLIAYVNKRGWRGLSKYTSMLFRNQQLRRAYQELNVIPGKYRFAAKCMDNEWEKGYFLWAAVISSKVFVKHIFRPSYHSIKSWLRKHGKHHLTAGKPRGVCHSKLKHFE